GHLMSELSVAGVGGARLPGSFACFEAILEELHFLSTDEQRQQEQHGGQDDQPVFAEMLASWRCAHGFPPGHETPARRIVNRARAARRGGSDLPEGQPFAKSNFATRVAVDARALCRYGPPVLSRSLTPEGCS